MLPTTLRASRPDRLPVCRTTRAATAPSCRISATCPANSLYFLGIFTPPNIVGYSNRNLGLNNNYVVPTFVKVSGEISNFKLGDIVGNADFCHDNIGSLQLLSDTGATAKFDWIVGEEKVYDQADAQFVYVSEAEKESFGCPVAGWYHSSDDWTWAYCLNDLEIGFANGFLVESGSESAAIVFSGAVYQDKYDVQLNLNNNYTGNSTPVTITLGDITGNADFCHDNIGSLQLLSDTGATAKFDWIVGEEKVYDQADAQFVYVSEAEKDGFGCPVAGWYHSSDDWNWAYCLNGLEIASGTGFLIESGSETAKYQVPNPMTVSPVE